MILAELPRPLRAWVFRLLSFYPPFLGAGVKVRALPTRDGLLAFLVRLPLTRFNRNYVGTHFGGSLFAMTDPFFMLIVMEALGPAYTVWDKEASIRFLKPGRGTVQGVFQVSPERIEALRAEVMAHGKAEPVFEVTLEDEAGQAIARVQKRLSIRLARRPG